MSTTEENVRNRIEQLRADIADLQAQKEGPRNELQRLDKDILARERLITELEALIVAPEPVPEEPTEPETPEEEETPQ